MYVLIVKFMKKTHQFAGGVLMPPDVDMMVSGSAKCFELSMVYCIILWVLGSSVDGGEMRLNVIDVFIGDWRADNILIGAKAGVARKVVSTV